MTYLITGATGFIGSWVVRSLKKRGFDMVLTDIKPDYSRLEMLVDNPESIPFVAADITQPYAFEKIFEKYDINTVIHLAALQIPNCRENPVKGAMVNVVGFLRLFEAVKKLKTDVKIVYASSVAVYGPQTLYGSGPVNEDVILKPTTHYGAFKVCNELTANAYWVENNIPSVGLRPHTVYGFGRDVGVTADITRALKAAVLGRPFKIRFGGQVDFQYAADVAEAFVLASLAKVRGARVYNIRGDIVGVETIVDLIHNMVPGSKNLVSYDPNPLPIAVNLDDSAFRNEIGHIEKTSIEEGLNETLHIFMKLKERGRLSLED
jgi:nucleoside-diphosphate-sugar epimerase